jgi:gluconate 5-dehydrogenase
MFGLHGKTALITGSTRGLGWAMAEAMARQGAHVVVNGRGAGDVRDCVDRLVEAGFAASGAAFDVADVAHLDAVVDDVVDRAGGLDIVVNNAGVNARSPLADFTDDDWARVLRVNLDGAFAVSRAASRHMIAAGSGRIIMTGSIMGEVGRPTIPAYVASKGAISALARSLAAELGPHGITVNTIGPGYVATEMNTALVEDPEFNAMVCARTPAGRWGRAEEIAAAAVFLASDEASYVNGHTLVVDGGMIETL